jgi:hypothetical protein
MLYALTWSKCFDVHIASLGSSEQFKRTQKVFMGNLNTLPSPKYSVLCTSDSYLIITKKKKEKKKREKRPNKT